MLQKYSFICLILILLGCEDRNQDGPAIELNEQKNTAAGTKIVNSIGETLNPASKKLVQEWPEYTILDKIIEDYYTITSDEALLKAKDLSNYAQQLRDSIRIDMFDSPDMKIRLNVLYNTSLRLADMETIKSIKPEEVQTEVTNLISAFSAINSKINNLLAQKEIEKELLNFEEKLK